jgi:1-acyl-sn-glycerol-3-phosphate acyltransferase
VDAAYQFVNGLGRLALRGLGVRMHWSGIEHLPTSGPVVLAANHASYPDFVFIERVALERCRYVRFLTRHDAWVPGIGWFMDRMGHVPVDRSVAAAAYLRARRLLREGHAVGIFPEAGISYSFTVRSLMTGTAALARETGAPVVPVAIWGTQRIYTVGIPEPLPSLVRGRRVDVAFGPPLYAAPDADLTAWTTELGHTLTGMLETLQRRPEHQPRPGEHAVWHPAHLGGAAPTRAEALEHDVVPRSAVIPSWGPEPDVFGRATRSDPPTR